MKEYKEKVPQYLFDLWASHGLGKYNNGLIELVNPKKYEPTLWRWLGKEVPQYVPIAIDGFGNLFYFKNLPQDDFNIEAGLTQEVCLINIQTRKIEHLTWSLEEFFESWLTNQNNKNTWLNMALFNEAVELYGGLELGEIFCLAPALSLGGAFNLENLKKGNALVYQDILFEF